MTIRRLTACAVLAVVAAAATGCSSSTPQASAPIDIGLGTTDGGTTTLHEIAEGLVVVNLWATWCGPCVAEMPVFDAVADARSDATVIGVNVGDSAADATAFATGLGIGYTVLTDPDGRLQTALGVSSLPATAFIAPSGEVLDVHQGAYTAEDLDAAIGAALAEVAP